MTERRNGPRIWARRDRSVARPRQALAAKMRSGPTEAERKLWWHLRYRRPVQATHFRRQVRLGRYIVDFACHKARLVIEVDGGQHVERSAPDAERTRFLQQEGYRVLRFWNDEVLQNIDGVLQVILEALSAPTATPTPDPSPQGGGEINAEPI